MDADLSDLPDDRLVAMMARHLNARQAHPVGTVPWAHAVLGYEACKRELDRRLVAHIVESVQERDGDRGTEPEA